MLWDKNEGEKIQKGKYKMTLNLVDLHLRGKVKARDLWRQKDIGIFNDTFTTDVAYHGVIFVRWTQEI